MAATKTSTTSATNAAAAGATTETTVNAGGAHGHPTVVISDKTKQILLLRYGYKIGKTLAVGGYGVVFEASNTSFRNKPGVALKVINTANLTAEEREIDLPKELTALMEVKHRYVVRVYDIFRHREHVFIFMELADGGDLATYRWLNRPLAEPLVASWFLELTEALAYLHLKMAIAHRDVKLCNVLLDKRKNTKLCDFGFAYYGNSKLDLDAQTSSDILGTPPCMSPQLLMKVQYNPYKADIFATGVSLFLMLSEDYPFQRTADKAVILAQQRDYPHFLRSRFPKSMSAKAKSLIELTLNPDEECRPGVADLLSHPFYAGVQPN